MTVAHSVRTPRLGGYSEEGLSGCGGILRQSVSAQIEDHLTADLSEIGVILALSESVVSSHVDDSLNLSIVATVPLVSLELILCVVEYAVIYAKQLLICAHVNGSIGACGINEECEGIFGGRACVSGDIAVLGALATLEGIDIGRTYVGYSTEGKSISARGIEYVISGGSVCAGSQMNGEILAGGLRLLKIEGRAVGGSIAPYLNIAACTASVPLSSAERSAEELNVYSSTVLSCGSKVEELEITSLYVVEKIDVAIVELDIEDTHRSGILCGRLNIARSVAEHKRGGGSTLTQREVNVLEGDAEGLFTDGICIGRRRSYRHSYDRLRISNHVTVDNANKRRSRVGSTWDSSRLILDIHNGLRTLFRGLRKGISAQVIGDNTAYLTVVVVSLALADGIVASHKNYRTVLTLVAVFSGVNVVLYGILCIVDSIIYLIPDEKMLDGKDFDAILSNPPYIRPEVIEELSPEVKNEPYAALYGGEDGLIFYNKIVSDYSKFLKKDGFFLFEIGYDQADDLRRIASDNGFNCRIFRDYGGNDRVALLKKSNTVVDAISFVKDFFKNEYTGHDYYHTMRVFNMATTIANQEGADLEIVQISALLHDVDDHKLSPNTSKNLENARNFLKKSRFSAEKTEKICQIIGEISYSKNGNKHPSSIEGKCVQDADRLDAIGAIGISRAFAFGGSRQRFLYDPCGEGETDSTIDHFYDKLFKLKDLINTDSARKIAIARDDFMHKFIDEFYLEWNGEK